MLVKSTEGYSEASDKSRGAREVVPPVDIFEGPRDFLILVDLPGVETDGVHVQLEPPELKITGRTTGTAPVSYARNFRVGQQLDPEGVTAELKDGVLSVRLRKSANVIPRTVTVKAG